MDFNQIDKLKMLKDIQVNYFSNAIDYWKSYSDYSHWQFWVCVAMLIVPLIVLFIFIWREKALLMGFYGYNVHMLSTYMDSFGTNKAYWNYPYKLQPILASSFSLDASLIPVCYILTYQWTMKRRKNYYIYIFLLSLLFAFVFKPVLAFFDFFQLDSGATYFHLFLCYLSVGVVSKWITNLFIYLQKRGRTIEQ